ncbi:hypothetical protein G7K_6918-t1 [Saitoella complicata NRRL Y-17804]|uniref:Uncharacterized protein n=1 Tax=Saitoella complicata (strain BCRC 22490 / CBS 7301 / JCM 7358 / NBRC 10748 / NRRL Y-17804) TaxID=698492 RepID=A0A0E9NSH3_SAICN|nr:hypothetical protein G7K_6918-t1 [Saitoella complicata NRRL Y-17804]
MRRAVGWATAARQGGTITQGKRGQEHIEGSQDGSALVRRFGRKHSFEARARAILTTRRPAITPRERRRQSTCSHGSKTTSIGRLSSLETKRTEARSLRPRQGECARGQPSSSAASQSTISQEAQETHQAWQNSNQKTVFVAIDWALSYQAGGQTQVTVTHLHLTGRDDNP